MAALTRFCALSHLYLYLFGTNQIFAGNAKAPAGHLLYGAAALCAQTAGHFPTFAAVAFAAQAIHGNGQTLMRFLADRAITHCTRFEAAHDVFHRFHFVERHRFDFGRATSTRAAASRAVPKFQKPAQRMRRFRIVHQRGIFLEALIIALARRALQEQNSQRIYQVVFARIRRAHLVRARCAHAVWAPQPHGVKGGVVPLVYKCRNLWQANSAHATNRIREIIAHHIWRQAHNLEYLRALITLQGRYAHFRRHLHNTLQNSVVVCAYGHISIAVKGAIPHKRANALVRQIRAHGTRAIAQKRGEVVHGNRFCAFQHHRYSGALFCAHKILFHGRHRQKRRNWHMVFVYPAVCEHNYVCARVVCFFDYQEQTFQRHIQRCVFVIKQADRLRL